MSKRIVIIGAGGHGKVVADIAKLNGYEKILFLDDDKTKKKNGIYDVVGTVEDIAIYKKEYEFFVAIGSNEIRESMTKRLELLDIMPVTLVHPTAVIDSTVKTGTGIAVMANAVINADTELSDGVIINTGATVDHDCIIGPYTHVCPGVHIAGTVDIGKNVWIGIGSSIINNIIVCSNTVIGAGSIVIEAIDESGVYVGIPARRIKQ